MARPGIGILARPEWSVCETVVDASAPEYLRSDRHGLYSSLNAAVEDACAGGGLVWIPPETRVLVDPPLRIARPVAILGSGYSSEVGLVPPSGRASDLPVLEITAPQAGPAGLQPQGRRVGGAASDSVLLQGFRLDGTVGTAGSVRTYSGQTAVRVSDSPYRVAIRDLWIDRFSSGAREELGWEFRGEGLRVVGDCREVVVDGTKITGCATGVRVVAGDSGVGPRSVVFRSSMFVDLSAMGLYAGLGVNVFVSGCLFEHCAGPAILAEDASVLSVQNCHFENDWSRHHAGCPDREKCPKCPVLEGCPNSDDFVCVEQPIGFAAPAELANYRVQPGGPGWPRAVLHVRASKSVASRPAYVYVTGNHLLNECADGDILISGPLEGVVRGNEVQPRKKTEWGLFSVAVEGDAARWVTLLGNHVPGCTECEALHAARCGSSSSRALPAGPGASFRFRG